VARVGAPEIEAALIAAVRELDPTRRMHLSEAELIEGYMERATARAGLLTIVPPADSDAETISVPFAPRQAARSRATIVPAGDDRGEAGTVRPIRSEARARLVAGIAQARACLAELLSGEATSTGAIAEREGLSERSVRMTLNLAFLAPELVKAAVAGALPHGVGLTSLADLPLAWTERGTTGAS
jgi:site-specific DNA recombinase